MLIGGDTLRKNLKVKQEKKMTHKKLTDVIKQISYADALALGPKKFVQQYLFPAMRREHGNGFAMQVWCCKTDHKDYYFDDVERPAPACGTVACIGGTLDIVLNMKGSPCDVLG